MSGSVASLSAYGFLRRQVRWSGIPISKDFPQFVVIYTIKGFSIANEADFLKFPYFSYDPMDVGNLISGSPAFSKHRFYIWKSLVHILLKPNLKHFEHNLASM